MPAKVVNSGLRSKCLLSFIETTTNNATREEHDFSCSLVVKHTEEAQCCKSYVLFYENVYIVLQNHSLSLRGWFPFVFAQCPASMPYLLYFCESGNRIFDLIASIYRPL